MLINFNSGHVLTCPHCDSKHIHQYKVDTYFRDFPESEIGLHVSTDSIRTRSDSSMHKNLSPEGDSTSIFFWCRNCNKQDFKLDLFQQDNETITKWSIVN